MFPGEMVILMAIAINKKSGKELLTRPMDVTSDYIGNLYNSLVYRGYLKKNRAMSYRLTSTGREALEEFIHCNDTRARDTVKRLQQLGIEISKKMEHKIGKFEKQAIKV